MSRANAYDIPSAEIALHFWRKAMAHEPWYSHPYHGIELPICRRCGMILSLQLWLSSFWERCPGAPDSTR